MKTFLIVIAVIAVIIIAILSLSATLTVVYDKGWTTKVKVLFIEKDIVLSQILSFILFPEKKAKDVSDKKKKEKQDKKAQKEQKAKETVKAETVTVTEGEDGPTAAFVAEETNSGEEKVQKQEPTPKKANPIKKLWDEEGIVGIMSLVSNILETANSAVLTLFKGLHIYSLYVMILVGGPDADMIARSYGTICKYYYPLKGIILNGMKVNNYDDYIQPDFIAPRNEYEFQLIASINVGLILKVALKAGFIFLKNLIKNKKGND